jgi:hypothetical protein
LIETPAQPQDIRFKLDTTTPQLLATEFDLGDDCILFCESSGSLYLLNPTAALVWQGLRDGLSMQAMAGALAEGTGQAPEAVARDLDDLVAHWKEAGLIAGGDVTPDDAPEHDRTARWWERDVSTERRVSGDRILERSYRLVDFGFRLRTADDPLQKPAHDLLDHVRVPDDEAVAGTLEIVPGEGSWSLAYNGELVDRCSHQDSIVPMVHGNLVIAAYKRSDCLVALHAAAVIGQRGAILLAGTPGSGKSTLTSALIANGFDYCADDTVLLTDLPIRVRGIPTRLGIKEGSWAVVARMWPGFNELPTGLRADGQRIRYLPPPVGSSCATADQCLDTSTLIFPRFAPDSPNELNRLTRAESLMRLTNAGYDTPAGLTTDLVRKLIGWLADLSCYELTFSDLQQAVELVRSADQ